jgi:coenzyme PQQ precursor peptide PqqA
VRKVLRTKRITLVKLGRIPLPRDGTPFIPAQGKEGVLSSPLKEENTMKVWNKPQVREQEVGLEVTSYLPAEIDII